MAGHLMVLNPKKKRRRAQKRRSSGRRRMSKLQRKYFGKRRHHPRVARKRRARHGETVVVATSNPVRRRRRAHASRYRRNPRRRYRRNPKGSSLTAFLNDAIVPAALGAAGALGIDLMIGSFQSQLPSTLTSGMGLPLLRMGGALALGAVVGMVAGANYGGMVAAGGLIVTVYGLGKNYLQQNTQLQLARYVPMSRYLGRRRRRRMGYMRRRRRMGAGLRYGRLGARPMMRRRRMGAVRYAPLPMIRRGMRGAQWGQAVRSGRNARTLGYIGPARTLGRYMQRR